MSIVNNSEVSQTLIDYKDGKIPEGLGIGCALDDFIKFKKGSFNMILGHDNTGKTFWRMWYYLCLAVKYDLKFCIWTGENPAWKCYRDLIKMYTQKDPKKMTNQDIYRYTSEISQWFDFVDNKKMYKFSDLLDIFGDLNTKKKYDGCMIDPFTGLDRGFGYSDNYEFCNIIREWVSTTGMTLDVCTHPVTSSGRYNATYPDGHKWEKMVRFPQKADTEGGKAFQNRCDDFIVVHRFVKSQALKYTTLIDVEKIKDTETGGKITEFEHPVYCEFNNGYGFIIDGVNPLTNKDHKSDIDAKYHKSLPKNTEFDLKNNEFNLF